MKTEFTNEQVALMRRALEQWGIAAQAGQTVEECAELIVALQKHFNRTPSQETIDNIAEEIADTEMMLAQMRVAFGIDDEVHRERIARKFEILSGYLEENAPGQ